MSNLNKNIYYTHKVDGGCYRIVDAETRCQLPGKTHYEPAVSYQDMQKSSAYSGQLYVTPTELWLESFKPAEFEDDEGNPISNPPPGMGMGGAG